MKLAEAGSFDGTDMHEHVTAAAIGMDEAITLLGVEPSNGAFSHENSRLREGCSAWLAALTASGRGSPPSTHGRSARQ